MCLIPFFDFYKLFPTFFCANNIESLVNNLFGVKIFNPFPSFTSSGGGMSNKSTDCSLSLFLFLLSLFLNYILKEITFKDHEALPYTFFFSFVLSFCGFSLLNLFK